MGFGFYDLLKFFIGYFYNFKQEYYTVTMKNIAMYSKIVLSAACLLFSIQKNYAEEINVKKYGAKGDGKTDDSKAVQAAINALPPGNLNTVYFPKGVYILGSYVTTPNYFENYFIRLHSDIAFRGEGNTSVIKLASHIFDTRDSTANAHLFYGANVSNIKFSNLLIDLNGKNNLVPESVIKNNCAIFIKHGNNVIISNTTIKNASGRNMIIIMGKGKNLLIEKNTFLNGGNYVGSSLLNKYQTDFSFVYCEWDSTRVINNQIAQGNLELALNGISGGIELHGSYSYAAGNKITGCNPGLYITSGRKEMHNTAVEKNRFINCTRGISFWLNYPMKNIIIKNNIIRLTRFRNWKSYTSNGIEVPNGNTGIFDKKYANAAAIDSLIITGNTITAPVTQTTTDRTAGMILHSLNYSTVSNNTITGMSFGGVILQGSKWGSSVVSITNNKFIDFKNNFDSVSPAAYIVIFDSYVLTDKGAPGIKNVSVSNNSFLRTKAPAISNSLSSKKTGRFTGLFIALPEPLQKEVHIGPNTFSNKKEKPEFVTTHQK